MSYARYLLSVREGRWLECGEEADHKDDDRLNDDPDNLQVLTAAVNRGKTRTGLTMVQLICPYCHCSFERERRQTHLVKGGNPTCCSRSCAARKQHGEVAEKDLAPNS
jgi:hypothetical protein